MPKLCTNNGTIYHVPPNKIEVNNAPGIQITYATFLPKILKDSLMRSQKEKSGIGTFCKTMS